MQGKAIQSAYNNSSWVNMSVKQFNDTILQVGGL